MKKLIVPIILGLVMFGLAFGGAFYFQHYRAGAADREIQAASTGALAALQKQDAITPYVARFAAVFPLGGGEGGSGGLAVVPGTVRYSLDPKAIKPKDAVWREDEKLLAITLPTPVVSAPELDGEDVRVYGGNGAPIPANDADVLNEHNRVTAKVSVLEQAKGKHAMQAAREAVRRIVRRAFEMSLQGSGVKAAVQVQFADENANDAGEDGDHAE